MICVYIDTHTYICICIYVHIHVCLYVSIHVEGDSERVRDTGPCSSSIPDRRRGASAADPRDRRSNEAVWQGYIIPIRG